MTYRDQSTFVAKDFMFVAEWRRHRKSRVRRSIDRDERPTLLRFRKRGFGNEMPSRIPIRRA